QRIESPRFREQKAKRVHSIVQQPGAREEQKDVVVEQQPLAHACLYSTPSTGSTSMTSEGTPAAASSPAFSTNSRRRTESAIMRRAPASMFISFNAAAAPGIRSAVLP